MVILQGAGYDTAAFALFLFQMVFMDTTATIPTGAAAERWRFSAFMIYGCCIGSIMYPVFGNWVWGAGWLSQMGVNWGIGHGHVDFAGSSVVHMQGGVIAFIFAWLIGPRFGKYDASGKLVNPIVPHSIPMCMLGTFILAFGWFGFNPGSSLAATDLRIAVVAVNTMLASATGALGATLWMWWFKTKKPDPAMMCNGMLAGLVAITCPCAFVSAGGASILGLVAGILCVESVFFFDRIRIDDSVGAISVHGVNGAWGCLSLGLRRRLERRPRDGEGPLLRRRDGPVLGRADRRDGMLRHTVPVVDPRLLHRREARRQPGQQGRGDLRPRHARDGRARLFRRGVRPGCRNSRDDLTLD